MKNRTFQPRLHLSKSVGVEKQKQKKGFGRPQVAPGGRENRLKMDFKAVFRR